MTRPFNVSLVNFLLYFDFFGKFIWGSMITLNFKNEHTYIES